MIARREFFTSAIGLACAAVTSRPNVATLDLVPNILPKRDYRSKPFRTAVAFGDSITQGWTATSPALCWVNRLADSVNESQLEPISIINSGIGGNVISPRSAGYDASGKPSAMERYQKHVAEHGPDLVTIAYGVNDARAGTAVGQFIEDLRHIVMDIKSKTGALVVMLSTSFMTDFNRYPPFDQASIAVFEGYNEALRRLAEECDVLYADTFSAMAFAAWTVDPVDGVHPNNLGHKLIADCVFTVLARNCSCLSQKALEMRKSFHPWQDDTGLRKTS
jgi:lysophospholipase L1-like esterase